MGTVSRQSQQTGIQVLAPHLPLSAAMHHPTPMIWAAPLLEAMTRLEALLLEAMILSEALRLEVTPPLVAVVGIQEKCHQKLKTMMMLFWMSCGRMGIM